MQSGGTESKRIDMALSTVVIFEDGREETIRDEYIDLIEAVEHAIALADDHGWDTGDGAGPPKWICVRRGKMTELALAVLRGGINCPIAN